MTKVDCRNRRGKFSSGRKVSSIKFISKYEFLVSTNDSRMRIYSLQDINQTSTIKYKYKGHKNENLQIEPSACENHQYILSGSEDGYIYIWNQFND